MTDVQTPPKISTILCVLNGRAWIERQLDALVAQSFVGPWEIVVVDNGSTDGTQDLVRDRASGSSVPIHLADASDRRGLAHARNVGARTARAQKFAFCDCDDVVGPGWLAAADRALEAADLVGGEIRVLSEPLNPDAELVNPGGVVRASFGNSVLGCNFAVQRSAYFDIGGFDESLPSYGCDDVEFSYRMNAAGKVGLLHDQVTGWVTQPEWLAWS